MKPKICVGESARNSHIPDTHLRSCIYVSPCVPYNSSRSILTFSFPKSAEMFPCYSKQNPYSVCLMLNAIYISCENVKFLDSCIRVAWQLFSLKQLIYSVCDSSCHYTCLQNSLIISTHSLITVLLIFYIGQITKGR